MSNKKGSWDKGLDYFEAKQLLLDKLNFYRNKKPLYQKDKTAYTYLTIGLIQLRNGCRVGEAVEALLKMIQTGRRDARVKVEKRKDNSKRLIVLPNEITPNDLKIVKEIVEDWEEKSTRRIANNISKWFLANLNINTHSLRYAFISHLGKKGVPAQLITHITGHATMDMIMKYTQAKIAEDILRGLE